MPAGLSCHDISIVIPTLNEAAFIRPCLAHLQQLAAWREVIVVDGGSSDGTAAAAAGLCDRVLLAERGRAPQQNAGAAEASGSWLWFLHADLQPQPGCPQALLNAAADPQLAGGCFRLRFPGSAPIYRISDWLGNLAVDLLKIAYGDHGIFCRRTAFESAGGFPRIPIMEDARFYQVLQRHGAVRQLSAVVTASPRRYEVIGPARLTCSYLLISGLYLAGVHPARLHRIYRRMCIPHPERKTHRDAPDLVSS